MKKLFVMVAAVAFAANVSAAVGEATGYATKSSTMYPDTASVIPPFSLSETCLYDAEGRLNTVLTSYNRTVYTMAMIIRFPKPSHIWVRLCHRRRYMSMTLMVI